LLTAIVPDIKSNVQTLNTKRPNAQYKTSKRSIHNVQTLNTKRPNAQYKTSKRSLQTAKRSRQTAKRSLQANGHHNIKSNFQTLLQTSKRSLQTAIMLNIKRMYKRAHLQEPINRKRQKRSTL
jgi:hypothetical protein